MIETRRSNLRTMSEKIMKSGQAPEKGKIRASAKKVGIREISDPSTMPKKIMKSGHDAGEDEESRHDARKDNEIRASTGEG